LVLLTGAEGRGKDMLISAARRRYAGDERLEFPARLATRGTAHDEAHISIPGRVFQEIERKQGFAVSWQHGGARHGLTAGALQALQAGRMVVIAIPSEAVEDFRGLWPDVEVVPLCSEVDRARPAQRFLSAASRHRVDHGGDIAQAVRRFHEVLERIAQGRAASDGCHV
jgi:ribose 1,5-bisphosphokinase PhnN